jgi:TRAP-type C4-dicarboxylate transport system permease small subunit
MKRAVTGGTHRGPVAPARQRRAIRTVQALLLVFATGLLLFAGYTWGRASGYEDGRRAGDIDAPSRPSSAQTGVLAVVGGVALVAALMLQGDGVRVPTPARLEELTGRAEAAAVERAEKLAAESSS